MLCASSELVNANGGIAAVDKIISCGELTSTGDIREFYSSYKRLKTNLVPIENALDKLTKINGYNFEWIVNKEVHSNKRKDVGVIAQKNTTTREN